MKQVIIFIYGQIYISYGVIIHFDIWLSGSIAIHSFLLILIPLNQCFINQKLNH